MKEFCELSLDRPRQFEVVINLNDVKQIDLTIPLNVLFRAGRVIK